MREHPHLELERELLRLTEELELERERPARSGDQRNVLRLERDLQQLQKLLEERQQPSRFRRRAYGQTS